MRIDFGPLSSDGKAAALAEGVIPAATAALGATKPPSLDAAAPASIEAAVGAKDEDRFDKAMQQIQDPNNHRQATAIRFLFKQSDSNRDGFLQLEELTDIMEKLGMAKKETKRMLQAADLDKDGRLDIDEFLIWVFSGSKKADKAKLLVTGFK